jgi:hypothetical protein
MISRWEAIHYKENHTWLPEGVRVTNGTRFKLVKILGLLTYLTPEQKVKYYAGKYYAGYGDVGVVYVYKLIWDDKAHNKNDFDEWFNSLDFSPICEDKDDGDWEDGCELHILVKDLFKFVFEHDIRFIELM